MKITADTNLLVRVVVGDNPAETHAASLVLDKAEVVVLTLPCLCELAWVLGRVYGLPADKVAGSIQAIVQRANVVADTAAVQAGLQMIGAGGDFADGVIAAAGSQSGGEIFVSFDRKAIKRLAAIGHPAQNARDLV